MTYFDRIDPVNDLFDQIYVHKPDWNNFYKPLETNFLTTFPKFLPAVSFGTKMTQILPFSPTITYFDQTYPINDVFDNIDDQKSDWNNI